MPDSTWLDLPGLANELDAFFKQSAKEIGRFGSTVNQVFEAFVLAQTIAWHREHGWRVSFVHPAEQRGEDLSAETTASQPQALRLKFSTRGRPSRYSYARCEKGEDVRQVRHGLRVMTRAGQKHGIPKANMVLDVVVIANLDLSMYGTDTPVPNSDLITFGEAKHMSAFAELVASFLGMVAELQPERLRSRVYGKMKRRDLVPFLYVSGFLNGTALGMERTIRKRGYGVDIYSRTSQLTQAVKLRVRPAPRRTIGP